MRSFKILILLLFVLNVYFSCIEIETPAGSNRIEFGITKSSEVMFRTATITTTPLSIKGNKIEQHGHCWGIQSNPDILGQHTSLGEITENISFSSQVTDLTPNTLYYVRSYITTKFETYYSDEISLKTSKTGRPSVNTNEIKDITVNSATCSGEALSDSGLVIIDRGLCWDIAETFSMEKCLGKKELGEGLGTFSHQLTNLKDGQVYWVKAWAKNEAGVSFGETKSFTTSAITIPSVSTIEISSITTNSAQSGGNITYNGNSQITTRGVVWGNNGIPTLENNLGKTIDGTGEGTYSSYLSGLSEGTLYYVRAYATNEKGTAYGDPVQFTTVGINVPTMSTVTVSNITTNSAQCEGEVIGNGNATVTARGIIYSKSNNLNIDNNLGKTIDGSGVGSFISQLTGLQDGTIYYVCTYATNSKGTGYGNIVQFTTDGITLPAVTTLSVTNITGNSVQSGGNVTDNGKGSVTARGIVWSTNNSPTIEFNSGMTTNGSGIGSFTSQLTNLQDGTTYYVRAYATNSKGTAYGTSIQFRTIGYSIPTVVTNAITDITTRTALGGGNVTDDGNSSITQRGTVLNDTGNPTLDNYLGITIDGYGTGNFQSVLDSLVDGTTYYVRAFATNNKGTAYGNEVSFTTVAAKGTFIDGRDGHEYKYVVIGSQTWMAENLAYLPVVSEPKTFYSAMYSEYFVYGNYSNSVSIAKTNPNYKLYGVLYSFKAAENSCPTGWHLPSLNEWNQLESYITLEMGIPLGTKLKSTSGWGNGYNGTDDYGFNVLPGGRISNGGSYWDIGSRAYFWTPTGLWYGNDKYYIYFKNDSESVHSDSDYPEFGSSVRCVKD